MAVAARDAPFGRLRTGFHTGDKAGLVSTYGVMSSGGRNSVLCRDGIASAPTGLLYLRGRTKVLPR
jgi:hypothetical protein